MKYVVTVLLLLGTMTLWRATPSLAAERDYAALEGVYKANIGGELGAITIVRTGPNELAVGLGTRYLEYGMTYSSYDPATRQLDAWTYPPGSTDDDPDYFITLHFGEDGSATGQFYGGADLVRVVAQLDHRLNDFLSNATVTGAPRSIIGTYTGTLKGMPFRLVIGRNVNGVWALGTFNPGQLYPVSIQFKEIYQAENQNVVYLTNRNVGGDVSFVQIRAQLTDDGLIGQYIIGGRALVDDFQLAPAASALQEELPPLGDDRLSWSTCETLPVDDPNGYTLRISRQYASLVVTYAELFDRKAVFTYQDLVSSWSVTALDHGNADRIDHEFVGADFDFRYVLWLDLDRPMPDDEREWARLRARLPSGEQLDVPMQCVPF